MASFFVILREGLEHYDKDIDYPLIWHDKLFIVITESYCINKFTYMQRKVILPVLLENVYIENQDNQCYIYR